MREKTRDGGRDGKACMCEKVARESMLPIMRMRVDACVKVEAASLRVCRIIDLQLCNNCY